MYLQVLLLLTVPYFVYCSCPTIISRSEWNARSPKKTKPLKENPPSFVVIHHTDTPTCTSLSACKTRVKNIQSYHMNNNGWDDIGYNFLIGGDGNVYEGRGWGVFGSHVPKYNARSIGISLIGNFDNDALSQSQLDTLKALIACAKENNYVTSNFHLIGHRQGKRTSCPGQNLFNEISKWPNFDGSITP